MFLFQLFLFFLLFLVSALLSCRYYCCRCCCFRYCCCCRCFGGAVVVFGVVVAVFSGAVIVVVAKALGTMLHPTGVVTATGAFPAAVVAAASCSCCFSALAIFVLKVLPSNKSTSSY